MNEAANASPLGTTLFDSMLGLAIRRHCAPVLDLDPLAAARRLPRSAWRARRRRGQPPLPGCRRHRHLPRGHGAGPHRGARDLLARRAGRDGRRQRHARSSGSSTSPSRCCAPARPTSPATSPSGCGRPRRPAPSGRSRSRRTASASGCPPTSPRRPTLERALAGVSPARVTSMRVSAWLAHTALEIGLPLQFHVGYGDSDLDLLDCDPLRLTAFLRATEERGVPVLLLHNYPYHRNAAYLAQVFDHVFLDLGLGHPQHRRAVARALPRDASSSRRSASCCSPPTPTGWPSSTCSARCSSGPASAASSTSSSRPAR